MIEKKNSNNLSTFLFCVSFNKIWLPKYSLIQRFDHLQPMFIETIETIDSKRLKLGLKPKVD